MPTSNPDGAAVAYLRKANAALQRSLGTDLWGRLDKRTRSCLVTSQVFHEMLDEVAGERDRELDRTGKQVGQIEAPEIDFSPVILCLFKAVEIEIERKIFRPFRTALTPARCESTPEAGWPTEALGSLATFVRHGKPAPNLKVTAQLFAQLEGCRADEPGLRGELKRWMRGNLAKPNRWWLGGRLGRRLQQAVDLHRNAAAHTGRLTPLEAQKAVAELWGEKSRPGLIPTVLRSIEELPIARDDPRESDPDGCGRADIRRGLSVGRTLLLKRQFWIFEASESGLGDRHLLMVLPGEFDLVKPSAADFKARRAVVDEHLVPLDKWFPADRQWGARIAIASPYNGETAIPTTGRKSRPLDPADCEALALALARAASALHRAGFVHGFISPHTVFRTSEKNWRLGGQALILLAQRGCAIPLHPRTSAPGPAKPADDVFAIAATVCCLRSGRSERNAARPTPADAETLFPQGLPRTALMRALAPDAAARPADGNELLTALTGRSAEPARDAGPCPVVISYSRADEVEAERILTQLGERGIRAWRDKNMIPGGAQWREAIVSAIDACNVVIFLVSKHSMESVQVPKELDIAADAKKGILPVCLDDTPIRSQFRYLLAGVHRLDFSTGDRSEALTQLVRGLRELGVTPEPHRRG